MFSLDEHILALERFIRIIEITLLSCLHDLAFGMYDFFGFGGFIDVDPEFLFDIVTYCLTWRISEYKSWTTDWICRALK